LIFNLVQYLRIQFPTETIYPDVKFLTSTQESVPDRIVIATDTGGTEQAWTRYSEPTIQILTRDISNPRARALAYNIFNKITSRFGLILPAIVVDSITYPVIETAQIIGIQKPYCLGDDGNGRIVYTTNYKITFMEE
jgi:hypothetical protein